MEQIKIKALANYLEVEVEEIHVYNSGFFVGNAVYLVLDEEEQKIYLEETIMESLWAFNSSFLADVTGIDKVVFEALSQQYENGNDAILSIVNATCGLGELIEEAVRWDGVGHFLAQYDGEEIELDNGLYAYRID